MAEFKNDYRCITMDLHGANDGVSSGPLEIEQPEVAYTGDHIGRATFSRVTSPSVLSDGLLAFSLSKAREEITMRMMLRWMVPVERGNETIKDGTLAKTIESLLNELKPEAAYFWPEAGERAGMMVFDMADPAQIPQIAEPLFLNVDAAVEFVPVMNADDLKRALEKVAAKG